MALRFPALAMLFPVVELQYPDLYFRGGSDPARHSDLRLQLDLLRCQNLSPRRPHPTGLKPRKPRAEPEIKP